MGLPAARIDDLARPLQRLLAARWFRILAEDAASVRDPAKIEIVRNELRVVAQSGKQHLFHVGLSVWFLSLPEETSSREITWNHSRPAMLFGILVSVFLQRNLSR